MNTTINNLPKTFNGDKVIGFTSTAKARQKGWMDRPSMTSWYKEDPENNYFGIVDLFTNFAGVEIPMMKGLLDKKAVINVNGMDGTFTYDIPVYKSTCTTTMKDTSDLFEFAGIDDSFFQVGLSKEYKPGDVLTYSLLYGLQFIVSEDAPVISEGDYYLHTVSLVGNDPSKYFPKEKLKKGISYFKVGHALSEFSTQFSNFELQGEESTLKCEFVLGNHRGVETNYTLYADKKSMSGATTQVKNMWNKMQNDMQNVTDEAGEFADMFFVANKDRATGKIQASTARFGSVLEYLAILENIKLEAHQLLFQKGGIIKTTNGTKRLNEGAWHQFRRGRRYEYTKPGGITKELLRQVISYVFQGRNDLLPQDRKIKFKAGYGAYMNLVSLFRVEFNAQLTNLALLNGTDRNIPSPVTGSLDGLILKPIIIKEVAIPDLGIVEVEYDPSLNYEPGSDRFTRGMTGQGYSQGSYSLVIYDASSEEYSNARTGIDKGAFVSEGGNKKANMYYVKPEGEHVWWGYEQGRWSPNQTSEIMSSSKRMSREFWIHSTSACWVKDVSKYIIVELKRK